MRFTKYSDRAILIAGGLFLCITLIGCEKNANTVASVAASTAQQAVAGPPLPPPLPTDEQTSFSPFTLGQPAPSLGNVSLLDGTKLPLESLRGKVVVLDFWATWCGPCREFIPVLEALDRQYREKGLVVYGISNEDSAKVRPVTQDMGMVYTIGADPENASTWQKAYQVDNLPTLAVVDRQGKIRFYEQGVNLNPDSGTQVQLERLIPTLLAEK